ncbi:substrate-specific activator of APC-dependent proteolysis [Orbilia brochopaga]|uniref:Substrate-specific activator of APC-dependent proteolysis n=1 Tax=Orbilia brochopaga TaxID=3140254 RepID=A0AAV9V8X2_9PEZI
MSSAEFHSRVRRSAGFSVPKTPTKTTPRGERSDLDSDELMQRLNQVASTPAATPPSRKRIKVYGDRYIPSRDTDIQAAFNLAHAVGSPSTPSKPRKRAPNGELNHQQKEQADRTYQSVLKSEIFPSIPQAPDSREITNYTERSIVATPPSIHQSTRAVDFDIPQTPRSNNILSYGSPISNRSTGRRHMDPRADIYSLSPIRYDSQRMLLSPRRQVRQVSKVPYKVLDAPDLADDFYLNLVDWGSTNILGVGLGSSVYMWNSVSGRVTKLCDLGEDTVTSVSWIQRGSHVAIGTNKGFVQIWDAERCRRLRTMTGHTMRVGALAWNEHILTSGSRDRTIYHRDVRTPDQFMARLVGHKQEVCGLKWNPDDNQLASGGNDNRLYVWDKTNTSPLYKFNEHTAAVKAIAWSPHARGTLASGGGTADRRIKFWDTLRGVATNEIDTGSQVCNLAWSKNSNEIVSTHGYSQNQIVVWKYPSMQQVVSLTGHTYRVLYLAMSPDGQVIVTGAGDETLRFWNCFTKDKTKTRTLSLLDGMDQIR